MEKKKTDSLKLDLDKVLKRAITKFGVGLEGYISDAIKVYSSTSCASVKESIRQDLGFLIRECVDDRGWYFDRHSTKIEEFLLRNISKIPEFPEPILFSNHINKIFSSQISKNNKFFGDLDKIYEKQVRIREKIFNAYRYNECVIPNKYRWVTPKVKIRHKHNINHLPLNIKLKLL